MKMSKKCPQCGQITYYRHQAQPDGAMSRLVIIEPEDTACGHIIRFELGVYDEQD